MMSLVIESTPDTAVTSGIPLFIPGLQPHTRTDGIRILTQRLAVTFVTALLLRTDQPLIVTVPAVQGLVRVGEAFVAGCRAGRGNQVHAGLFFLVQFGGLFRKDLM